MKVICIYGVCDCACAVWCRMRATMWVHVQVRTASLNLSMVGAVGILIGNGICVYQRNYQLPKCPLRNVR